MAIDSVPLTQSEWVVLMDMAMAIDSVQMKAQQEMETTTDLGYLVLESDQLS